MKNVIEGNKQNFEIILHHLYKKRRVDSHGKALTLTVTSMTNGEGVSTIAEGLSEYLSSIEDYKILLISNTKEKTGGAGLTVFDARNVTEQSVDTIFSEAEENNFKKISIYNSGSFGFHLNKGWGSFWNQLTNKFDAVIVDGASFQTVLPILWNQVTEQTVLVIDAQKITKQVLTRFKAEIESNGYKIDGFILNNRSYPIPDFIYRKIVRR